MNNRRPVEQQTNYRQNRVALLIRDKFQTVPADGLDGGRCRGCMILIQALMRNVGTDWFHGKGREDVNSRFASTKVNRRDGATGSRVEASVMEVERRGCVIQSKWVANPIMGGAI